MPRHVDARGVSFAMAWLVTFLAFTIVGTVWSVAQPVFSGSDESQHASQSEAVWSGQFLPPLTTKYPTQIESGMEHVPILAVGSGCYNVEDTASAKCDTTSLHGVARSGQVANYVSREPPLPALLTGLPLHLAPDRVGFYLSRFLTSVLGAALLATAVALACARRRPILLLGVLVAATPSFIAEFGVLGSSQLEIGSALVLWVCVTLFVTNEKVVRSEVAMMTGSLIVLLLARPASIVYAGLALAVLVICAGRTRLRQLVATPWFWPMLVAAGIVLLFSLWWLVFAEAPTNPAYITDLHLPRIGGWGGRISYSLGYEMTFWTQMIGASGTNDYGGPAWLPILWTMMTGSFVLPAVMLATRRRAAVIIGVLAVLLVLPVAAQAYYVPTVYLTWMGRYDLPVFVGLVVFAAGALEGRLAPGELRRALVLGIGTVALLQVLEFASVLRRYTVGTHGPLSPLSWARGWHPPHIAALPLLVCGSAAILCAYGALWHMGRRTIAVDLLPSDRGAASQEKVNATGRSPAGIAGSTAPTASP